MVCHGSLRTSSIGKGENSLYSKPFNGNHAIADRNLGRRVCGGWSGEIWLRLVLDEFALHVGPELLQNVRGHVSQNRRIVLLKNLMAGFVIPVIGHGKDRKS